jgi:hypothetical protein
LRLELLYVYSEVSSVGIATGYGLDDRGFRVPVPVVSKILSPTRLPDPLQGLSSRLSNGYRGLHGSVLNYEVVKHGDKFTFFTFT